MRRHTRGYDALFFLAILATLFALAPGMAHVLEMPRKLLLGRDAYFAVQQIYAGWSLFGIVIAIQLAALAVLAWRSRREYYVFRPVLTAILLMMAAQALFWSFTFPANAATSNWTVMTQDWPALRLQWEYSHAYGALCQLLALCCLLWALFARVQAAGR